MSYVDARLREMQFLARLEREAEIKIEGPNDVGAERQMIISLLDQGYVNGIDTLASQAKKSSASFPQTQQDNRVQVQLERLLWGGPPIEVRISHRGRVRRSELEQQLKTGRDRDDTGLLWAKRHLLVDLAIAVLSAGEDAPLSVAFLDMNGLSGLNNTYGHAVGDDALRAFFQATTATLGQPGEVYRNGGDEVVVILRGVTDDGAVKLLDGFVRQLGKDALAVGQVSLTLTASCGSVSTTDPNEDASALLKRADEVLYKAKPKSGPSKACVGRASAFAVGDGEVTTHLPQGS